MREHTARLNADVELWRGEDDKRMYLKVKDEKGNSVLIYLSAKLKSAADAQKMWEANFKGE